MHQHSTFRQQTQALHTDHFVQEGGGEGALHLVMHQAGSRTSFVTPSTISLQQLMGPGITS